MGGSGRKNNIKNHGFTLIELSIVMIIIGFIVAGIVGGQTLIRQARLRSVISEEDSVKTSINAFRVQYNEIPGDFDNAFSFWPTCGGGVVTACNGNGNKAIELTATPDEVYLFWEHLNLAKLYPGSFTGTPFTTGDIDAKIGINVPGSKFPVTGITVWTDPVTGQNQIMFGGEQPHNITINDVFTTSDASSIDQKIDDGQPGVGIVQADGQVPANCRSSTTAYNLSNQNNNACHIWFTF